MSLFRRAAERTGTPAELLVVGLGNPGAEFGGTRHNAGAESIRLLAERHGGRLKAGKERALVAEVRIASKPIALAIPTTYMNLSGESVRLLVPRFGITDPGRVVIVHDELDLPVAQVKVKFGGGTAGHNGLKSIQAHLGTADFIRVRIGVGRPGSAGGADHVLKRPGKADRELLAVAVEEAADAVELILSVGVERAMNAVNTRRPEANERG